MESEDLKDLLVDELKDLFSAEGQLIKALPKMAKAATAPELKAAFEKHLKQTREHAARIEKACRELDETPRGSKCKAMEGLIEEGKELIEEHDPGETLDAALIAAAQKVEHYEIGSYGTVKQWAELLDLKNIAALLDETLQEEKETDESLTQLAQEINLEAMASGE